MPEAGTYTYEIEYEPREPRTETRRVDVADNQIRAVETPFAGHVEVMRYAQTEIFIVATHMAGERCVWDSPIRFYWEGGKETSKSQARCVIQQGDSKTEFTRDDRITIVGLGGAQRKQEFSTTIRSQLHQDPSDDAHPRPALGTETKLSGHQVWSDGRGLADRGTMHIGWTGPTSPVAQTLHFVLRGRNHG